MSGNEKARRPPAGDDVEARLAALDRARANREKADRAERGAVAAARGAGASWSRIGQLYGLTKQGAQQRFKHPRPSPDSPA